MQNTSSRRTSLVGNLLIAHPSLLDPHFRRSVILISAHSAEEGAVGVVLNRPLGKMLESLRPDLAFGPLADIPLFQGGPVAHDDLILTAWGGCGSSKELKLHFGLSVEQAEELISEAPDLDIRAFLGYSGWSGGQLEGEIAENIWLVTPLVCPLLEPNPDEALWKRIVRHVTPDLSYLADAPDDPTVN